MTSAQFYDGSKTSGDGICSSADDLSPKFWVLLLIATEQEYSIIIIIIIIL